MSDHTTLLDKKHPSKKKSSTLDVQDYSSIEQGDYYFIDETEEQGLYSWRYMFLLGALALFFLPFLYTIVDYSIKTDPEYIQVPDLIRIDTLDAFDSSTSKKTDNSKLILIGDVHGELTYLERLLEKAEYKAGEDHVVLLGDMISKGPDSIGVLEYAMAINASCVRGNHEDEILRAYAKLHHLPKPKVEPVTDYELLTGPGIIPGEKEDDYDDYIPKDVNRNNDDNSNDFGINEEEGGDDDDKDDDNNEEDDDNNNDEDDDNNDGGESEYNSIPDYTISSDSKKVAKQLKKRHIKFLGSCPLILELGNVSPFKTRAVAVHAGIQWNIKKLYKQHPVAVMTMRTLMPPKFTKPTETSEGRQWSRVWNAKQKALPKKRRTTVYYGHDARHGLNPRKYSYGLDSACVKGGSLSAMVITKTGNGGLNHTLVSVPCS